MGRLKRIVTPEMIKLINTMYAEGNGYSGTYIAKKLGIAPITVYKYLTCNRYVGNKLRPYEIERIKTLYKEGMDYIDVAIETNVNEQTVRKYVGNGRRKTRVFYNYSEEDINRINDLYNTPMTLKAVAKLEGVSYSTIYNVVKKRRQLGKRLPIKEVRI